MSHVQELYRQEAFGLISSREFDRRFDDAVEQDMIDSMAQRDLDAEYEAYIEEEKKYYEDMINSMLPHDRKHELNPGRMDLKGGHRHNHIYNVCYRITFRGKYRRRLPREDKNRFVENFWANIALMPDVLNKILANKRKRK